MTSTQHEPMKNPHQWLYNRHMFGKNINVIAYDKMVRTWNEQQKNELIENMCLASNQIAIASRILTRLQHEKYREKRVKDGRNAFYLFPCDNIPMDIFLKVKPEYGKRTYFDLSESFLSDDRGTERINPRLGG